MQDENRGQTNSFRSDPAGAGSENSHTSALVVNK